MIELVSISFVLAGILASSSQIEDAESKPLFPRIFPKPTGANGMEEYIRAVDMISDAKSAKAISELTNPETPGTLLSRSRGLAKFSDPIIKLIRQGNAKPCFDPRPIDVETLFPEYARFRTICKILNARVYCEFAEGSAKEGVRILLDAVRFADSFPNGTLISELVSIASRSIMLHQIEDRFGRFGIPEAELLESYAKWALTNAIDFKKIVRTESQLFEDYVSKIKKGEFKAAALSALGMDDEELRSEMSKDELSLYEKLKSKSEAEMQLIFEQAVMENKNATSRVLMLFDKPERDWSQEDFNTSSVPSIENALVESFSVGYDHIAKFAIAKRTQLRLLIVDALIIKYFWTNGKLPVSLKELGAEGQEIDPLTERPFLYEVKNESQWKLSSEGTALTGPIGIRYRPTLQNQAGPEPPEKTENSNWNL